MQISALDNNVLESFEQLAGRYQLSKQDFFRFLQIRHYILKNSTLIDKPEVSSIVSGWRNAVRKPLKEVFSELSVKKVQRRGHGARIPINIDSPKLSVGVVLGLDLS